MHSHFKSSGIGFLLALVLLAACGGSEAPTSAPPPDLTSPPAASPGETSESLATPAVSTEPAPVGDPEITVSPPPLPDGPVLARLAAGDEFVLKWIRMLDGFNGWAVAESGGHEHLLRTWDGGLTWEDESPPMPLPETGSLLLQVSELDFLTAWATYYQESVPAEAGYVWKTTDGGFEWSTVSPFHLETYGDIDGAWLVFADEMLGGYISEIAVFGADGGNRNMHYRTFNGGGIWQATILSDCPVTGYALSSSKVSLVSQSCLGSDPEGVDPTYLISRDAISWHQYPLDLELAGADLPASPRFCETHSPFLFDGTANFLAVTCYADELGTESILNLVFVSTDQAKSFGTAYEYPGGTLFMLNDNIGWALGREIHQTLDGGKSWAQIKTVAWDGAFSFIDRWRAWAVAVAGDEVALVRTLDSGRTWEIIEAGLEPPPPDEPCVLSVNTSTMSYLRPSFASDTFGELSPGMPVYGLVRSADGWIGFGPGVAQAANMGVFRYRWFPPGTDVVYEGACGDLPIVEGPPAGVCFTMPMGHVPVYAGRDVNSDLLVTLTSDEYAAVEGYSRDEAWMLVDLSLGNTGLNLKGWMERFHANFNGPCFDLPLLP